MVLAKTAGFLLIVVSSIFAINQFISGGKKAQAVGINYKLPKNQLVATSSSVLLTDGVQSTSCNTKDSATNEQFVVPGPILLLKTNH